jgi:3-deoxy-D-manno-octulosonate 8-phosphate phosphatase (KDO 8-P phosphatase)
LPKKKSEKQNTLSKRELKRRARNIKLVLADCDGVLTDTGVYFGENGEVMKRFSIRDGMGTQRLRAVGIETGYISGEVSPSLKKRAEKLKLVHVYLGIDDKLTTLRGILSSSGFTLNEIAYIGDDVNDLDVINEITKDGLTATPGDGMPMNKKSVHYVCKAKGGNGAFRDFAEWILFLRGSD